MAINEYENSLINQNSIYSCNEWTERLIYIFLFVYMQIDAIKCGLNDTSEYFSIDLFSIDADTEMGFYHIASNSLFLQRDCCFVVFFSLSARNGHVVHSNTIFLEFLYHSFLWRNHIGGFFFIQGTNL